MTKTDLVHLRTILDACVLLDGVRDLVGSAAGLQARPNELAKAARLLTVIGEAARNITPASKAVHDGIPWPRIARMHSRLSNFHFGVDYEAVWATLEQDLPPLEAQVRAALPMADAWWGGDKGQSPGNLPGRGSFRVGR